jgi:hypothetical protein
MTSVYEDDDAIWWTGPLAIDADGAPNAYHPDGKSGLDYLANAGKPGNWYGLVVDTNGKPVVQGPGDPCPGFYVSPTSLQDPTKKRTDPRRYVDSTTVPYVAVARDLIGKAKLGDVALVYCKATGRMSAAIVADVGPKGKYGEGSVALARALGLPGSAKNGGAEAGVTVVVFKASGRGWPRIARDVAQQAQDRLNALGGDFDRYL